ncbi:MAG: efflux RND transporter permease subunit, partial [Planctomycetota bacterium]
MTGRNSFDLVLRVDDAENPDVWANADAEMVEDILVDTPSGAKIPLAALANISREVGPNMISRENARRKIVVMCNVAGRALGDVVSDIQRSVAEQIALPPGYYVDYGGQFESAEATRNRLGILGVLVVLGIGFMLYSVFQS